MNIWRYITPVYYFQVVCRRACSNASFPVNDGLIFDAKVANVVDKSAPFNVIAGVVLLVVKLGLALGAKVAKVVDKSLGPNVIAGVATFWALLDTFGIFFTPTSSQPDLFSIGQANLLFNCPFTPHW